MSLNTAGIQAKLQEPAVKKGLGAALALMVVGACAYLWMNHEEEAGTVGRFVALTKPMSWDDANSYCTSNYAGLASIHSRQDQQDAIGACKTTALSMQWDGSDTGTSSDDKRPVGCWIGLADTTSESAFTWADGTPMDFSAWSPGEPTEGHHATNGAKAAAEGEDAVHLTFVHNQNAGGARSHWDDEQGAWNDNHVNGEHGHNENNAYGFYPICQTTAPTAPFTSTAKAWHTKRDSESCDGKYVAVPRPLSWEDAGHYCRNHGYYDLASIHSWQDQASAVEACRGLTGLTNSGQQEGGTRHACWIGMHDSKTEMAFEWSDSMYVNYHAWNPGEPNSWGRTQDNGLGGRVDRTDGGGVDENYVAMDFRNIDVGHGGWNDAANTGLISVEAAGDSAHDCFGCYGNHGLYPLCERRPPSDSPTTGSRTWTPPAKATVGRFVAIAHAHKWTNSEQTCTSNGYLGLASIHTREEETEAEQACNRIVSNKAPGNGLPSACWIGLNQAEQTGSFTWTDHTAVEYQHFKPGEPNNWGAAGFSGELSGNEEGEVAVAIATAGRVGTQLAGYWNDDHNEGLAGHNTNGYTGQDRSKYDWTASSVASANAKHDHTCFGCTGVYGQYALCQTQPAGPCQPEVHRHVTGDTQAGQITQQDETIHRSCDLNLACHQELSNDEGAASVAPCCRLPPGDQPHCHVNVCHNDGDFQEVAFPAVDDMCGCIQACLDHPQASSYQYNSDGWCGCLSNSGDQLHTNANAFSDSFSGACALCAIDHMSQNVNTNPPFGDGR